MTEKTIDGIKVIEYGEEKDKPPLIFIHAFPLNQKMWDGQVSYFKNKHRIITYDVRGLGLSIQPDNQFTMEKYANDLLSIIESLRLEKCIACGLSMGGYILLRAFEIDKSRFSSLILSNTKAERDSNEGILSRAKSINEIKTGNKEKYFNDLIKKLLGSSSYSDLKIKSYVKGLINDNTDEGICGSILAIATRTDTADLLGKIDIPVLIISGENDTLIPPSIAEQINRKISNSYLRVIKEAGHLSNIENPKEYNFILDDFLKNLIK